MNEARHAAAEADTPEQILAAAQEWYRRQMALLRLAMGPCWGEHKAWVADYLREEVRLRLIARGWRARGD